MANVAWNCAELGIWWPAGAICEQLTGHRRRLGSHSGKAMEKRTKMSCGCSVGEGNDCLRPDDSGGQGHEHTALRLAGIGGLPE